MNDKQLAKKIIDYLRDRKGFDDWWDSIDTDIQRSIESDLADNLEWWTRRNDPANGGKRE